MLNDHSPSTSAMANSATGLTVGSGATMWITENATLIGLLIAALGLIVGTIFHFLNYRENRKASSMRRDEIVQEVIDQVKSEIPEYSGALNKIRERRIHRSD